MPLPRQARLLDVDESELARLPADAVAGPLVLVVRQEGIPTGSMVIDDGAAPTCSLATAVTWRRGAPPPGPCAHPISVTVGVCTRNRPERLARCLASVADAIAVAGDEVAAIMLVVDNASPDDRTREVALAAGAVVGREPVPGLDIARNRAVSMTTTDVLAFVDDDVVVDPTWLRTLARTFAAHPDAAAVTGGVLALVVDTPARFEFERCGGFFKGWTAGPLDAANRDDLPYNPSLGVGCNMAFRRRALDEIGPFDEALDTGPPLPGGGDLDALSRVAMVAKIVYEPSALVRHEHRATMADLRDQYRSWGLSWGAMLHKWYRRAPSDRALIRRAAVRSMRHYLHDLLLPTEPGRRRRTHASLMLAGFVIGVTTAYPRSCRRMRRRQREHRQTSEPVARRERR
jgi:GT2 family glycosyltransferase